MGVRNLWLNCHVERSETSLSQLANGQRSFTTFRMTNDGQRFLVSASRRRFARNDSVLGITLPLPLPSPNYYHVFAFKLAGQKQFR